MEKINYQLLSFGLTINLRNNWGELVIKVGTIEEAN